jgi:hypothetical protein
MSYIVRVMVTTSTGVPPFEAWMCEPGVYDRERSRARRFVTRRAAEQAAADVPADYKPKIETT